jgi:Holliday junction resolvase RusA-like endonuclease
VWVATKPDTDKLERSSYDALTTAGIWRDDSLAVKTSAEKRYDSLPGASVQLTALAQEGESA